ncbi:MAG: tetratricopeptide repeat protein [Acidobacteriota bacterium]
MSTFTITGSIRNPERMIVSGVRVSIIDENFQTIYTGFVEAGGRYKLERVKQGRYTVRVETIGTPYEEESQSIELSSMRRSGGNEVFPVDFILKYRKGEGPPARTNPYFVQDVPKAARTEFEHSANDLKANKTSQAIASLKKAVEIFPDYFDALEALGMEYVKSGQYEAALPILTRAIAVNKRAPKSMYALGVAHLKLTRLPEAIEWLEKSARLDSNSANTQMMIGLAYGNSGTLDKAESAFKKALQIGGQAAAEAHYYLTGLYNKQERFHDAWQELELFLKEAKNVKDPAQIKAMIANLKEKEKGKMLFSQPVQPPAGPSPSTTAALNEPAEPLASNELAAPKSSTNSATLGPVPPLPPEYIELLRQADTSGAMLHKQLLDYTYQLKKTHRILNDRGNSTHTQEQVFEAYPVHGEHVLITLSRDGIPSRTVSDERKRAAKQLEEAERHRADEKPAEKSSDGEADGYVSAGVTGVYQGKVGYVSINISTILRSCEFFSPRAEKVGDREMIVINYRHRAGVQLTPNHKYIAGLVGTVWIDQTDKVVTRLEGWPASAAAFDLVQSTAPRDEAALIYQQTRQADGAWFPSIVRMNAGGRTDLFDGLNWDVVFEFSNYQRFNTSANEKLNSPQTQKP